MFHTDNLEVSTNKEDILLMILEFLKSNNLIKTLVSLESETGVQLEDSGPEVAFLREVILNGDFDEALRVVELFKKSTNFPYQTCVFEIKKQKFLELIDSNNSEEVNQIVELTKELESLTSKQTYNELCFILSLNKITDHPDYVDWNIYKGRMNCFNEVKKHLRLIFPKEKVDNQKVKPNYLIRALSGLLIHELNQNKDLAILTLKGKENHFSFLDPHFMDSVERTTAGFKLNFAKQTKEIPKSMYASIKLNRKNENQNVETFGIQSVHFENLQQALKLQESQPVFNQPKELERNNVENISPNNQFDKGPQHTKVPSKGHEKKFSQEFKTQKSHESPLKGNYGFPNTEYEEQHKLEYEENPPRFDQYQFGFPQQRNEVVYPNIDYRGEANTDSENPQTTRKISKNSSMSGEQEKNVIIEKLLLTDTQRGLESEREEKVTHRYDPPYEGFDQIEEIGLIQDIQPIRTAAFSPDGEMFAIGTNSKHLRIYSIKPLFQSAGIPNKNVDLIFEKANHHFGSVYSVDWSNTGRFIASGSNDKLVKIISVPDFDNDKEFMELKLTGHKGIVRSVCFTLDDSKLLSGGADFAIKVWDVQEGVEIRTLEGHKNAIYCIQASGDGNNCVSVGMDKCLKLWDIRAPKCLLSMTMNDYAEMNYVCLSENTKNYNTLRSSKRNPSSIFNGTSITAGVAHIDGMVTLWDLTERKIIDEIKIHEADCRSVEFDAYSGLLATSSFDATIGIYDVNERMMKNRIQNHTDRVVLAKWHPFYPVILSTSADTTARLFAPKKFMEGFR